MPGQEGADVLELAHARNGLAGGTGFEIADRQAQQVPEQALPEFHVDPVGGVRQGIGALVLQKHVEQADDHDADDEHEQGRIAFVGQHLVDHHLEEQGRHQGEDLDEQRRQQHVRQRLAVAPDRGQEPAEPEALRIEALAADPPGKQDQVRIDLGQQFGGRQQPVDAGDGVDETEQAVRHATAEHHEPAVAQLGDARGRRSGQILFGGPLGQARLQADDLAGPQQVGCRGLPSQQRQFPLQMDRIGRDPVIGRDAAEGPEARVRLGW